MKPPTDIMFTVQLATVQLMPSEINEADLKAPAGEFARLTHANQRATEEKLFVHKAKVQFRDKTGSIFEGMMQSAIFDTDQSNGRQELKEMMDEIKHTVLQQWFETEPNRDKLILTPDRP